MNIIIKSEENISSTYHNQRAAFYALGKSQRCLIMKLSIYQVTEQFQNVSIRSSLIYCRPQKIASDAGAFMCTMSHFGVIVNFLGNARNRVQFDEVTVLRLNLFQIFSQEYLNRFWIAALSTSFFTNRLLKAYFFKKEL